MLGVYFISFAFNGLLYYIAFEGFKFRLFVLVLINQPQYFIGSFPLVIRDFVTFEYDIIQTVGDIFQHFKGHAEIHVQIIKLSTNDRHHL